MFFKDVSEDVVQQHILQYACEQTIRSALKLVCRSWYLELRQKFTRTVTVKDLKFFQNHQNFVSEEGEVYSSKSNSDIQYLGCLVLVLKIETRRSDVLELDQQTEACIIQTCSKIFPNVKSFQVISLYSSYDSYPWVHLAFNILKGLSMKTDSRKISSLNQLIIGRSTIESNLTDILQTLISYGTYIEYLQVDSWDDVNMNCFSQPFFWNSLPKLKSLVMTRSKIPDNWIIPQSHYQQIEEFRMEKNWRECYSIPVQKISSFLDQLFQNCSGLKKISLNGCDPSFADSFLTYFSTSKLKNLEELNLATYTGIIDPRLMQSIQCLSNNTCLQVLKLHSGTKISDDTIYNILHSCPKLRELKCLDWNLDMFNAQFVVREIKDINLLRRWYHCRNISVAIRNSDLEGDIMKKVFECFSFASQCIFPSGTISLTRQFMQMKISTQNIADAIISGNSKLHAASQVNWSFSDYLSDDIVYEIVKKMRNITHLSINKCQKLTSGGICHILANELHLKSIKFSIEGTNHFDWKAFSDHINIGIEEILIHSLPDVAMNIAEVFQFVKTLISHHHLQSFKSFECPLFSIVLKNTFMQVDCSKLNAKDTQQLDEILLDMLPPNYKVFISNLCLPRSYVIQSPDRYELNSEHMMLIMSSNKGLYFKCGDISKQRQELKEDFTKTDPKCFASFKKLVITDAIIADITLKSLYGKFNSLREVDISKCEFQGKLLASFFDKILQDCGSFSKITIRYNTYLDGDDGLQSILKVFEGRNIKIVK